MLSPRPWTLESLARLLWWLLCGLAGVSLASALLDRALNGVPDETREFWLGFAGTLCFHGVVLAAIFAFLRANRLTWATAFGLRRTPVRHALGLGATAAVGFFLLNLLLMPLSALLLQLVGLDAAPQDSIETLRSSDGFLRPVLLGFLALGVAPVMEELIFRGLLYPTIKQLGFPRVALWGTSVLFALSHANLLSLLPLVALGWVQATLYERTDNLLTPIVSHFVFNTINFVLALTVW
jgi:membrane protease YdiL (CAAX protease family)